MVKEHTLILMGKNMWVNGRVGENQKGWKLNEEREKQNGANGK